MSIFATALFVFALSSCGGGGVTACSCAKDAADIATKMLEEGADVEALGKESTALATKCADAAEKDAEAYADCE